MALSLPYIDVQAPACNNDDEVDLLAIDFFGEDRVAGAFDPALTDQLHIGVLTSDQYTQTRVDEILDIKRLTDFVRDLNKEMTDAKHELKFIGQVMSASFEDKIEVMAFQLQSRLMERMQKLQKLHEDRIAVVRRSFKQQLQDALVRVSAQYKNYYEGRINSLRHTSIGDQDTKRLLLVLQLELQNARAMSEAKEREIMMLKEDLLCAANQDENADAAASAMMEVKNRQLEQGADKLRAVKADMEDLQKECDQFNMTAGYKDKELKDLRQEVADLNTNLKKEKIKRKTEAATKAEPPKSSYPKITPRHANSKSPIGLSSVTNEKEAAERKQLQIELDSMQKSVADAIQAAVAEERKQHNDTIMNLRRRVEELQEQEALGNSGRDHEIRDAEREATAKERQRWLKAQNRWEKKFQILRSSLHAIKDEAFIRGQLQKQTMPIRYAAVAYGGLDNENVSPVEPIPSPAHQTFEHRGGSSQIRRSSRNLVHVEPTPSKMIVHSDVLEQDEDEEDAFYKYDQDPLDDDDNEADARLVPLPDKPNFGSYMQISSSKSSHHNV